MRCDLAIDGDKTLLDGLVSSLEYREAMDELDSLVVQLHLPMAGDASKLVKKLKPGVAYKLTLGKRSAEGDIVRVSIRRGSAVPHQVTLWGLEKLHRLRNQRLSEVKEQTRGDLLKALLGKATVSGTFQAVKATASEQVLLDADMLRVVKQICVERNFTLYFDGKKVVFGPRGKARAGAVEELVWGFDVVDASLDADLTELVTKVTAHGRDYRKPDTAMKFTADKAKLGKISGGKTGVELRTAAFGDLEVVVPAPLSMGTSSAVEESAIGLLQRRAEGFLRGTLECDWLPDLMPAMKVKVKGAEWPLGGPFLVHAAAHSLSGSEGYTTTLEVFSDSYPAET
jgi:hypothetical protein